MYEELKERISKGQWAEAKKLANILEPADDWDSEYAVLLATICEAQGERSAELRLLQGELQPTGEIMNFSICWVCCIRRRIIIRPICA